MNPDIKAYHQAQTEADQNICSRLHTLICEGLPEAKSKVWHAHPVWFLNENPIVGYSKLKNGLRLMFWSGADFEEETLKPSTGKFKDASVTYTHVDEIDAQNLKGWLQKAKTIQWDYKNLVKRKGVLERLEIDA